MLTTAFCLDGLEEAISRYEKLEILDTYQGLELWTDTRSPVIERQMPIVELRDGGRRTIVAGPALNASCKLLDLALLT